MSRLQNGLLVVATAFFASSLSYPVFAEENSLKEEEVSFVERKVSEVKVEEKKEAKKVYLENLKENFDFGGSVKTFFSYSGIPTSNIDWFGNEFRPLFFKMEEKKVNSIATTLNAGIKGSLNFGKTFKNDAGKNVLKVSTGLEVDLRNDEFDKTGDDKKFFKIASAKGILYDCFKIGYDSLFVGGAKTVMMGGIFKVNNMFTLSCDIFRDLSLVDIGDGTNNRSLSNFLVDGDNKEITGTKAAFKYNSAIPGVALHNSFNFGSFGKANLSLFGRPVLLKETKEDGEKFIFGFGAKANAELHFIDKVDTLKVNVLFGSGIGDYMAKVKKATEKLEKSHSKLTALPASFYIDEDKIKPSMFLDGSLDYAFKINPVNEVSLSCGNLWYINDYSKANFVGIDGKNWFVNDVLTFGLGYKYSACKKMDLFINGYGVYMHVAAKDGESADELPNVSQKLGWGFNFGADMKL